MKKLYLLSFIVIVLVNTGCSTIEPEKVDNKNQEATVEETKNEAKTKVYKVGETVDYEGLHITVNEARISKGNFIKPQKDKFLYVTATIENKTDQPVNITSIGNLKLAGADGTQYNVTIVDDANGQLDGEVGPGRKMKGEAVFDVSESDYYEFIFSGLFSNGQAIWKIENK